MKERHGSGKINRKEFRKKQEEYAERIRSHPGRDDSVLWKEQSLGIYPYYADAVSGLLFYCKKISNVSRETMEKMLIKSEKIIGSDSRKGVL